jgi:hypothetical protein
MFLHHTAEKIVSGSKFGLNGWMIESLVVAPPFLVILFFAAGITDPSAVWNFFVALITLAPFWMPPFLAVIFWVIWMHYIRYLFWFSHEYIVLEIQLPQEVEKSPLAMETFFTALWNTGGETTFIARIWNGSFRVVWSLEIASNEGRVGFYIHTRKSWRNIVEARLYGLFPDAKVIEVDDYVSKINFNLQEYDLFGAEFTKPKANPQALPIKTYVDFKMDKDPKEEFKVDPIANIVELLGQVGKDEHYWFQIVLKPRKKDEWYGFYLGHDAYKDAGTEEIKKIMAGAAQRAKAVIAENEITEGKTSLLTDGEKRRIDAIERSMSKLIFECGFRVLYFAKKDRFTGINIPQLIQFFSVFNGDGYEHNRLGVNRGTAFFDFPWQDFRQIRKTKIKELLFFFYKYRAYFYVPYDQEPVFLTTEELATLWHFPGSSIKTPGLNRVAARRAEAPPNLPTLPS